MYSVCNEYVCALEFAVPSSAQIMIIAHYQIQLVNILNAMWIYVYCHCNIQYCDHVPSSSLWVGSVVCLFVLSSASIALTKDQMIPSFRRFLHNEQNKKAYCSVENRLSIGSTWTWVWIWLFAELEFYGGTIANGFRAHTMQQTD